MTGVTLPTVTVVIPARNASRSIERAVESIIQQDYEGRIEIVVAEGGSADDTRSILERFGERVRVVDNPGGLTPDALNAAIGAGTGEVVVRCDAHAWLPPGYVKRAVATLEETGAANVGGIQEAVGHTLWERVVAAAQSTPLGVGDARYRLGGEAGPVDTVYLGVFRRDAVDAVGGYDRRFQRNQDYELNWRLRLAGELVWFDPELRVAYTPRSSLGSLARQYFDYGRWKRHMVTLHPKSIRPRQVAAPALVAGLTASAMLSPWAPGLAALLPVTYGAALVAAGIFEAVRHRDPALLLVSVAIPVMHIPWGVGFYLGHPEMRS